jgi:LemA protein
MGGPAEAYPTLGASTAYLELQRRISGIEEQIAHRREFFNAAVNLNNTRMQQLPDSLLAGLARMRHRDLFSASEGEKSVVDVGARLSR